jgi:hypothetical protein
MGHARSSWAASSRTRCPRRGERQCGFSWQVLFTVRRPCAAAGSPLVFRALCDPGRDTPDNSGRTAPDLPESWGAGGEHPHCEPVVERLPAFRSPTPVTDQGNLGTLIVKGRRWTFTLGFSACDRTADHRWRTGPVRVAAPGGRRRGGLRFAAEWTETHRGGTGLCVRWSRGSRFTRRVRVVTSEGDPSTRRLWAWRSPVRVARRAMAVVYMPVGRAGSSRMSQRFATHDRWTIYCRPKISISS